jgi:hypothetical protein
MTSEEKINLRIGAFMVGLATGTFAYGHYREFIKKKFVRSEGHHRFTQKLTNMTPWRQLYFTWHRMPSEVNECLLQVRFDL